MLIVKPTGRNTRENGVKIKNYKNAKTRKNNFVYQIIIEPLME